jgi:hypothetical protein
MTSARGERAFRSPRDSGSGVPVFAIRPRQLSFFGRRHKNAKL